MGKDTPDTSTEPSTQETISPEKQAELDQRLSRNALRILQTIVKAMPTLAKNIAIKGNKERVAHDITIPGIEKYSAMIIASYIIVKGEKSALFTLPHYSRYCKNAYSKY